MQQAASRGILLCDGSWSIPLLMVPRSPPSGSAGMSPPEPCLVPYSVGLRCLPAGSSSVFELENHSKFCIPLKSVVFRALCSRLHGFKWKKKKKDPWSMETVGNWNSSFPRVVSSCSLQMNFSHVLPKRTQVRWSVQRHWSFRFRT